MDLDRWWIEMHDMRAFRSIRSPDEAISRVASRLGGVIDRAQLVGLGLGRGAIRHRIEIGRLRPVYHGVYAVGHEAVQTRGLLVAGLLAAGPGAALSHRTAAGLLKLLPSMPPFVEMTTTKTRPRNPRASSSTTRRRSRHRDSTGCPSPPPRAPSSISPPHAPTSSSKGRAAKRSCSASSPATSRFNRAMRKAGLPLPFSNAHVLGEEVDFHWPEHALIAEVDGWGFHGHRIAFERDRRRDAKLQLAGYAVVRFTWRQLCDEPAAVAAVVARFLSRPTLRRAS